MADDPLNFLESLQRSQPQVADSGFDALSFLESMKAGADYQPEATLYDQSSEPLSRPKALGGPKYKSNAGRFSTYTDSPHTMYLPELNLDKGRPAPTKDYSAPVDVYGKPMPEAEVARLTKEGEHTRPFDPFVYYMERAQAAALGDKYAALTSNDVQLASLTAEAAARVSPEWNEKQPDQQLAFLNQVRSALGLPSLTELPGKETAKSTAAGIFTQRGIETKTPIARGIVSIRDALDLSYAKAAMNDPDPEKRDRYVKGYSAYLQEAVAALRGRTFAGQVVEGLAETLPFALEWAVSGTLIPKAAPVTPASTALGRVAQTAGRVAVESAQRLPGFATNIGGEVAQRVSAGEDFAGALAKAGVGNYAAIATLGAAGEAAEALQPFKNRLLAAFVAKKGGTTEAAKAFAAKFGWYGLIENVGAMEATKAIQAQLDGETYNLDLKDLGAEAATVAIAGAALHMTSRLPGLASRVGKLPDTPSRRQLEESGVKGETNSDQRQQLVQEVRRQQSERQAPTTEEIEQALREHQRLPSETGRPPIENPEIAKPVAPVEVPFKFGEVLNWDQAGQVRRVKVLGPGLGGVLVQLLDAKGNPTRATMTVSDFSTLKGKQDAVQERATTEVGAYKAGDQGIGGQSESRGVGQGQQGQEIAQASQVGEAKALTGAERAKAELTDLMQAFMDYAQGRLFSNPFDPEFITLGARVAGRAVKAGIYEFSEFVEQFARRVGSAAVSRIGPYLERAWAQVHAEDKSGLVRPAGKVKDVLDRLGEIPPPADAGRPDLNNPQTTPEGRDLQTSVDEMRNQLGEPARRSDKVVAEQAKQLAERQPLEETVRELGTRVADLDVLNLRATQGLRELAPRAVQSGDVGQLAQAIDLADQRRSARAEIARALRGGERSPGTPGMPRPEPGTPEAEQAIVQERIDAVHDLLLTPSTEVQQKIEGARQRAMDAKSEEEAKKALADLQQQLWESAQEIIAIKEDLKSLGVDVDKILADGNPVRIARMAQEVAARKRGWSRQALAALLEFQTAAMLSGIKTQGANIVGGLTNLLMKFAERVPEAAIGAAIRVVGGKTATGPRAGDILPSMRGFGGVLMEALHNAAMTWRTGLPWFTRQFEPQHDVKFEHAPQIPGAFGSIVRLGLSGLQSADQFFATIGIRLLQGLEAHAELVNQGVRGEALEAGMRRLMKDPQSTSNVRTVAEIDRALLRDDPGFTMQLINRWLNRNPAGKFFFKFLNVGSKLIGGGLERTPVRADLVLRGILDGFKTGDWSNFAKQASKQITGLAAFAVVASLGDNITGASEEADPSAREYNATRVPPMSFRLPGSDTWHSYRQLGWAAHILASMADLSRSLRTGDPRPAIRSVPSQALNASYLEVARDLAEFVQNPEYSTRDLAGNLLLGFVPAFYKQARGATRPFIAQRRAWDKTGEQPAASYMHRLAQRAEMSSAPEYAKYDTWGNPVANGNGQTRTTDTMWRLVDITSGRKVPQETGDAVLRAYNYWHPSDTYYPLAPRPQYKIGDEQHEMNPAQYAAYCRLSGEAAKYAVEKEKWNTDTPGKPEIDRLQRIITASRNAVAEKIVDDPQLQAAQGGTIGAEVRANRIINLAVAATSRDERKRAFESQAAYTARLESDQARRERAESELILSQATPAEIVQAMLVVGRRNGKIPYAEIIRVRAGVIRILQNSTSVK